MKLMNRVAAGLASLVGAWALGDPTINSIDLREDYNSRSSHTEKYKTTTNPRLVIRRTESTTVHVVTNKDATPENWTFVIKAKRLWDGTEEPVVDSTGIPTPVDKWSYYRSGANVINENDQKIFLWFTVPPNAKVGTYEMRLEATAKTMNNGGAQTYSMTKVFPKKVVVLFNPFKNPVWVNDEAVYIANKSEIDEYVMGEEGGWTNRSYGPYVPWGVSQFDEVTLDVWNYILDKTPGIDRSSPVAVSREFSGSCNWRYWTQGIIEGNWDGGFTPANTPHQWKSTADVLKKYTSVGPPYKTVQYGQCWVFGNVMTSLLRSSGIGARTVSVFETGIDNSSPPDGHLDEYWRFDAATTTYFRSRILNIDSSWNFHVWTEAWMKRPDLTGGDGWQELDPTSQAPIDPAKGQGTGPALKKIGPASRSILRAAGAPPNTSNFDNGFMWSSVRTDKRKYYERRANIGTFLLISTTNNADAGIGRRVWVKKVGDASLINVASDFRPAPRAPEESQSPSLFDVQLLSYDTADIGQDIHATMVITNGPVPRTLHPRLGGSLFRYNGDEVTTLADDIYLPMTLAAGEVRNLDLTIPAAAVLPHMNGTQSFVRIEGSVYCDEIEELKIVSSGDNGVGDVDLVPPVVGIGVMAAGLNLGQTTTAHATFTNTTGLTLTNARAEFAVGPGLSIGGEHAVTVALPDIGPGADASIPDQTVQGDAIGKWSVGVTLLSDQLPASMASIALAVASCPGDLNGDGLVDDEDFVLFADSYNLADCTSEDMSIGCPGDLNTDGFVNDADFTVFAAAYDQYYCP